ncbi:MAG: T9SS type A sorting domain-containing protein [Bacteroidetes bacterium]|nr:T9SS type A sorting domain-containing protein [Bacteroidota bacterium]
MRKMYLLGLMAIASASFAQAPKTSNPVEYRKIAPTDCFFPTAAKQEIPRVIKRAKLNKISKATIIGTTQCDLQTNGSVYSRLQVFPDGKMSATWTLSSDGPDANYVTRGSAYQHFNGTTWLPKSQVSARIESERTGFPCYAYNPTTNEEIIMSHIVKASGTANAAATAGLMMNTKAGIGPGAQWDSKQVLFDGNIAIPSVLWNRTAISGDYMIVIANYSDSSSTGPQKQRVRKSGVPAPLVYSRYKISTKSWEVVNQTLPGYDSTRYNGGSADNYSMDARGNEVAILACDLSDDIALWRSSNNGANWTKTIVLANPLAGVKLPNNTKFSKTFTADGSCFVVLDSSNKAHCFWGRGAIQDDDTTNTTYSYFPSENNIDYWYEGRPSVLPDSIAHSGDGLAISFATTVHDRIRYGNSSSTTMPSATVAPDGTIYLLFSSITDDPNIDDGNGGTYRNIYLTFSKDNGLTWADSAFNASSFIGIGEEHMFASIAKTVDNSIHFTFLQSAINGQYTSTNNSGKTGDFNIYYVNIPVADIMSKVVGVKELKNNVIEVGQNYPNPSNGNTIIPVNFKQAGNATVTVTNLIGQVVYSKIFANNSTGLSNLEINLNNANAGVYIYSVETEGYKITNKMIVE